MATFKFILKKNKVRVNGKFPLVCRLTQNRKHSYYNTKYFLEESKWDSIRERVKKNHKNHKRINLYLSKEKTKIEQILFDFEEDQQWYSANQLKLAVTGKVKNDFIEFAEDLFNKKWQTESISISTFKKYESVLTKLKVYCKNELAIRKLNPNFLDKYQTYLSKKLENRKNTIAINMKCIRVVVMELIREGLIKVDDNPFLRYKIEYEETERKFLFPEEIDRIREYPTDPKSRLHSVRLIFLFCLESGLRIGDALFLEKSDFDGSCIRLKIQKTQRYTMLPLTDRGIEILDKYCSKDDYQYCFPFINPRRLNDPLRWLEEKKRKTSLINKYLKVLGKKCKLTISLSSHVARHSMATNALYNGLSYQEIQSLLGHNDVKTTQIYAKTFDKVKVDAVSKMNSF